ERKWALPPDDHMGDVRLLLRVYGSKRTHRLLPARLALAIVAALEPPARRRRNPVGERQAERLMKDLLLYTPRASEAPAMARRHLRERARARELCLRPWLLKRSRVIGREHWE